MIVNSSTINSCYEFKTKTDVIKFIKESAKEEIISRLFQELANFQKTDPKMPVSISGKVSTLDSVEKSIIEFKKKAILNALEEEGLIEPQAFKNFSKNMCGSESLKGKETIVTEKTSSYPHKIYIPDPPPPFTKT